MKKAILFLLYFLLAAASFAIAEEFREKDWWVETREGKVFYLTNGKAAGGNEFGFFKDPISCEDDVFWVTSSSQSENVINFQGQGAAVSLHVDGNNFTLRPVMEQVGKMDATYIMTFTNWVPSEAVIKAFEKGHSVKMKIVEPLTLKVLLDTTEDTFSLMGFKAARRKAKTMCGAQ